MATFDKFPVSGDDPKLEGSTYKPELLKTLEGENGEIKESWFENNRFMGFKISELLGGKDIISADPDILKQAYDEDFNIRNFEQFQGLIDKFPGLDDKDVATLQLWALYFMFLWQKNGAKGIYTTFSPKLDEAKEADRRDLAEAFMVDLTFELIRRCEKKFG